MSYQSTYHPTPMGSVGEGKQIVIDEMRLMKVNGYQKQFLRPMETQMTNAIEDEIGGLIDQYQTNIPTTAVANMAGKFIMPSSRVDTVNRNGVIQAVEVNIPNGWVSDRFIFVLRIRTIIGNSETTELVTGYTDRLDYAQTSRDDIHIAPDTVFYINSITKLQTRVFNGLQTNVIGESLSVFGGGLGVSAYGDLSPFKMTPGNLVQSANAGRHDAYGVITDVAPPHLVNTDYKRLSDVPSLSRRNFNSPTNVVSTLVDSYAKKVCISNTIGTMSPDDVFLQVRGTVGDPSVFQSGIMQSIYNTGRTSSTFTWDWLQGLDPYLDHKTSVDLVHQQSSQWTAPWDSPTLEATLAVVVSTMVTNLMNNSSLAQLEFLATNRIGNQFGLNAYTDVVEITNILGYTPNIDYRPIIPSVEQNIRELLCPMVSRNNEIDYQVRVICGLNIDTSIFISIGNNPEELFTYPSFADSSISPILTTDQSRYSKNVSDINALFSTIDDKFVFNNHFTPQYGNVNDQMGYGHLSDSDDYSQMGNY